MYKSSIEEYTKESNKNILRKEKVMFTLTIGKASEAEVEFVGLVGFGNGGEVIALDYVLVNWVGFLVLGSSQ